MHVINTSLSSLTSLALAVALLGAGCGGDDEEAETAGYQQQGQYGQQQPGYGQQQQPGQPGYGQQPQQQPGYGAQPGATAPPGGAAPPAGTAPPAAAGGQAQALDPSAGAVAQPILNGLANTEAPGAKPLGSALVGNFQQGQTLESQLQLQPGKCYTVVAVGMPPVSEVNIQLLPVSPIPGFAPVLAQDQTAGAQAVLGKSPNCYKWAAPFAVPVRLVITVAGGSGLAAAQVYEK